MCLRYSIVKRNKKERKNDANRSGLNFPKQKENTTFIHKHLTTPYSYTHGKRKNQA